jgi:hypothetical protein
MAPFKRVVGLVGKEGEEREEDGAGHEGYEFYDFFRDTIGAGGFARAERVNSFIECVAGYHVGKGE